MSIANDFRAKMDVALDSADRSRGDSSQDARRARLQQDLDIAGLVLMPKEMLAAYTITIEALQAQVAARDAEIVRLSGLIDPIDTNEREAIEQAIRVTEYKYFGDYEMSGDQVEAVEQLALTAQRYLARAALGQGEG